MIDLNNVNMIVRYSKNNYFKIPTLLNENMIKKTPKIYLNHSNEYNSYYENIENEYYEDDIIVKINNRLYNKNNLPLKSRRLCKKTE